MVSNPPVGFPSVLAISMNSISYDFNFPFFISRISQIYFVKYDIGGQYKDHYDANPCGGVRSDYSMTCFLSDDYSGGELVIENKKSIKLNKGKAVVYPGNLLHRVNQVTSGRRDVFICWIEV